MKKKALAIITVLAMILAMTACGDSNSAYEDPEDVSYMETEYNVDADLPATEFIKTVFNSIKTNGDDYILREAIDDAEFDISSDSAAAFVKKVQDFDYEIISEKETAEGADVTVKITTYDFATAYKNAFDKLPDNLKKSDLSDADKEKMESELETALSQVTDKNVSNEIVIKCIKDEGKWTADFESYDFINTLLGGMLSNIAH